ncbi:nucleotidyltransferase domain-containing protein [Rhodoferax fermentans]|uniref:Polymerase beta nucleotidyltransferase domain-containing protein n=1 Tax=Rhodoferax fermentans TaxID=28066 RepID=A0A1T1ANT2_RHOFE|nr:nucleotidyltransferase domain-containing protein [Rhodoferax fermentans]MBK1683120.1 nucleotidyltransferase domain-containing protein [Rhodoferax fermentans]OOV05724.1 hypothetical protein RF819_02515 [Rhodoferax fermentans]
MNIEIMPFLRQVLEVGHDISSIWLFGSRANGTDTEKSDWDFIAFGSEGTLERLQSATNLHRQDIDFMVVTNGIDFRNAWGPRLKSGSLKTWEWKILSEDLCEYMQSKEKAGHDFDVECTTKKAIRVWP